MGEKLLALDGEGEVGGDLLVEANLKLSLDSYVPLIKSKMTQAHARNY